MIHVGASHIYGIDDRDIALEGYLNIGGVSSLISRVWRSGAPPERIASNLIYSWFSFYRLGRDLSELSSDLIGIAYRSQLGRRMAEVTTADLSPNFIDSTLSSYLDDHSVADLGSLNELSADVQWSLDQEGSHLAILVQILAAEGLNRVLSMATPLEVLACMPDAESDRRNDKALQSTRNIRHYELSVPGGWPRQLPAGVPGWVADAVINNGARMVLSTAGYVPSWTFVAESVEELRAVEMWTYNPGFFVREESNHLVLGFRLTYRNGDTAFASYRYRLTNADEFNYLRTLLSMKLVRLDVYQINPSSTLEYVFSFGTQIPEEVVDQGWEYIERKWDDEDRIYVLKDRSAADILEQMAWIETNAFECLALCHEPYLNQDESELPGVYRNYLQVIDSLAKDQFRGSIVDVQRFEQAREDLRNAIGRARRGKVNDIDLGLLGKGRAYCQFSTTGSEPDYLMAKVAYLQDGIPVAKIFEFSSTIDLTSLSALSWDIQAERLSVGLNRLVELIRSGVHSIVLNLGASVYNLPFHEAFLRMGFVQASYSHRTSKLSDRERSAESEPLLVGHAGVGSKSIAAVDIELAVLSELYDVPVANMDQVSSAPSVAHFAGHGRVGAGAYQIGLELGSAASDFLSSARILFEFDWRESDLVFLSACSTGRGEYSDLQLMESVPLDVALVESGARVVVSTSAPVNDIVSFFFSCVMHHAVIHGESIWSAYLLAREAASTQVIPQSQIALEPVLDRHWVDWRSALKGASAQAPWDWQLFRVSGRCW
ncbi:MULTISPECIES: CHAT domain-containing protein [Rhodococcus]|uniref:CHAT domain-containing protein n=1 Tax=Rhodococcus TaxID=1827 RepID=UPI0012FC4E7F|nr:MULTISPECIES: CHAT domain-containing protein [Rhodococcus]QQZ19498.1 CHAT domain-containing protein [Rhodococcus sp. 21391]